MVKVTYAPYAELVVHEVIQQDGLTLFEDMVRQALASQAHAEPTVNWAEGVAFVFSPMPPTEDIVKEGLAGKLHYASVMFTKVPYQSRISVKIGNQDYGVRLRRAENNHTLLGLARFLKDFAQTSTD
ncbi:MAG: hypothetical protein OK438_08240 [Thaumarchaeota archaeon]|nr:hypothetical protein [Nitrososphaerota archaeon]